MANCLVMPFFGRKGLAMNTRKNTLYNVAYRVFSMLLPLVTCLLYTSDAADEL